MQGQKCRPWVAARCHRTTSHPHPPLLLMICLHGEKDGRLSKLFHAVLTMTSLLGSSGRDAIVWVNITQCKCEK